MRTRTEGPLIHRWRRAALHVHFTPTGNCRGSISSGGGSRPDREGTPLGRVIGSAGELQATIEDSDAARVERCRSLGAEDPGRQDGPPMLKGLGLYCPVLCRIVPGARPPRRPSC